MRNRPTRHDDDVLRVAATELAVKMKKWIDDDDTDDELLLIEDIINAIKYDDDGYSIARHLDDYSPDARLVEILDNASFAIHDALRAACGAWVAETGAVGPAIGTAVVAVKNPEYGDGEVTHNHSDGRSTVMFPKLGHVLSGVGTHGIVIEWELLRCVEKS